MEPLVFNLGPTELLIILAILLLLFGGARLAGLGKSTGRALREFKEETKDLKGKDKDQALDTPSASQNPAPQAQPPMQQPMQQQPMQPQPMQQPMQQPPYPPAVQQPTAEQWPPAGNVQPGSEVRRDS